MHIHMPRFICEYMYPYMNLYMCIHVSDIYRYVCMYICIYIVSIYTCIHVNMYM